MTIQIRRPSAAEAFTPTLGAGYTLVELVAVLTILAVGVSSAAPTARRLADDARVSAARETVARGFIRGRAAAVGAGGSVVTVVARPARIRVEAGGATVYDMPLGDERTTVELTRGRDSLSLRFDALGIGRFTSATVVLRRGDADAGLVLSSYGRIRRR